MQSFLEIQNRIAAACLRAGRPKESVTLVAASKTVAAAVLSEFFAAGLANLGENYVQEALPKIRAFREQDLGATWHLIGALQSNKTREAVENFDLIHSVDRFSLARELQKEAAKIGKNQKILLQVNLGHETSKSGCKPENLPEFLAQISEFPNLRFEGLMSLPPYKENPQEMRPFHQKLRDLRDQLSTFHFPLSTLSMGMSNDFEVAIEEGATLVRVGTALFGARS